MQALRLSLLGPIEIEFQNRQFSGAPHDKGFMLLSYLAAESDRPHSREALAEMLWPDLPAERGRHNLRQTLFRLRSLLGNGAAGDFLETDRHRVWFNRHSDYRLDLDQFLHARDDDMESLLYRLGLYRGMFMEDLRNEAGEDFGLWLEERRARTHRLMLTMLEAACTRYESQNDPMAALRWAGRYVELAPWDEDGHRRLIRLLADNGQRGAAIAHYRAMAESLDRELGIAPSPESRRLLERIEQTATPQTDTRTRNPAWHGEHHAGLAHEYRQITVLRCGFAYQDIEDPEAFAEEVAEPIALAVRIIEEHNGWIAAARSTGILAYFGWPTADERAATHAVRAAIGVVNQVSDPIGRKLATGIHTGPIILTGETSRPDTIGMTTDIAVRLQVSARPGIIAISEATRRCIRDHFELTALPPLSMAEQKRPLSVWRVHRGSQGALMDGRAQKPPLIGRDAELECLLDDWEQAQSGRCTITVLVGDAGLGKTRLLQALHEKADRPLLRETYCDPLMQQTPYHPIMHFFRRHLDLPRHCPDTLVTRALSEHYAGFPNQGEAIIKPLQWLLARPSSPQEQDTNAHSGDGERHQLAEAVAALLETSAEATPLLLVIEDLHWADPSTLALLGYLATRLARARVHICLTMRSTACLPANLIDRARILQLRPLDLKSSLHLTQRIAPPDKTSGDFALVIAKQSEGNPLFIVELTHMLHDDALDDALPGKLQELISTRIEQAGADKPLLRAAAIIGREFSTAHLAGLLQLPEETVSAGLDRLTQRHLIDQPADDNEHYHFTHALVHQTTYQSATRSQRRALHQQYAALLQSENDPDAGAIAWHLTETGSYADAVGWWLKSGRDAAGMAAYVEATSHFERGLQLLEHSPERARLWSIELDLLINLAYPLAITQGYYGAKSERLYRRALEISKDHDVEPRQSLALLRSYWFGASSRKSFSESRLIAGRMIELAESVHANAFTALGHYLYGNASLWLGDFSLARDHLEETLSRMDRKDQETEQFLRNDQQFDVTATGYLGWNLWFLGHIDRSLRMTQRAVHMAETRHHPATLMAALATYIGTRIWCQRADEVAVAAKRLGALCREHGFRIWDDVAVLAEAWARTVNAGRCEPGGLDEAEETLHRVVTLWPGGATGFQYILLDACLFAADTTRGWRILSQAWTSMQATGSRAYHVGCKLAEARLLALEGQNHEHCLREAIEIAEQQQARSLEILAWGRLARHYAAHDIRLPEGIHERLIDMLDHCSGIELAPELAFIEKQLRGFA
ncbi:AAA family ATPase [Acidihalobacter prosperus]|uniref:Bacterial transcriptional activator domain-containing protein n=1 Tax=Acidihalobacter prosperus TaxID=160660 RepID=A0A1A6C3C2_9GAMM|nr:AAA family ATPase [Acidihalobacter prosperus]OBS09058.1 hypothetical protein Thpro_021386 [Acidihalobacter prosperus]